MKRKHRKTLDRLFSRPVSANIPWRDIESLFVALRAEVSEREGSRIEVFLFDEVRIYHRPHPQPDTDKGAVAAEKRFMKLRDAQRQRVAWHAGEYWDTLLAYLKGESAGCRCTI